MPWLLCATLLAGALAFVPHPAAPVAEDFMAPRELVLQLAALAAGVLCLARARTARLAAEDVLLAGFALLALVSYRAVSVNPWLGARAFGITWAGVALFWCARAAAQERWGARLTAAAAAAAVLLAVTVLIEAYGGLSFSLPGRSPGGVLGHRNSAAHLMVLALPLLALHAARARHRVLCVATCAGAGVAAMVVVLSRSRGAWIGAAVIAAVAVACLGARGGRWALAAKRVRWFAAALVLGGAAAVVLPNRLAWREGAAGTLRHLADYGAGSGHGRVVQYGRTLRMIADHPLLGVGPGNWTIAYPAYAAPADPSYQPRDLVPTSRLPSGDWLGLAAERGIPALLLLLAAGATLALRAARTLRRDTDEASGGAADGSNGSAEATTLLCVLAAVLVMGVFDPLLQQPLHALFVCIAVGALAPPGRAWWQPRVTSRRRWAVGVAYAIVAVAPLVVSARQLRSTVLLASTGPAALPRAVHASPGDYRLQAMMAGRLVAASRCDRARPHIRAARALFPAAPAPRVMERQCARASHVAAVQRATPVDVSTQ